MKVSLTFSQYSFNFTCKELSRVQLTFLNGGFHFQVFGPKPNGWVRQFSILAATTGLDITRDECVRALDDILSQGHEVEKHFVQAGN